MATTKEQIELDQNAAGRMVPAVVNGKPQVPYLGVGQYEPNGRKAAPPVRSSRDYPDDGNKRVPDLETALRKCGLHDGAVISNHHHLRDGDSVALVALEAASKVGVKDLMWFPSASFPSQKSAIELMERGVIHHIEGSMNGPLGDYCTQGRMRGMGVLRSHGGRWEAGIMRNGFSFQAGAGGIALAFVDYLRRMMKEDGVKARFVRGGSTKYLVDLLQEGLTDYILDGQTFDLDGVKSIAGDPRHVATSPFTSYNYHGKGNFASLVDAVVLGATEVDVNFNANVVTHSDGRLLHGIGGWQNCLEAGCTILALPSFRDRIPVIVDEVTTLTGPGELIDVIATERGIAVNPRRQDLLDAVKDSSLPIRPIQDIKAEVEKICGGKPARPKRGNRPVAVVKWVDGTVLDTVWQVS